MHSSVVRPGRESGSLDQLLATLHNRHDLVNCGWSACRLRPLERHILRDLKSAGCWVAVAAASTESRANAQAGGADAVVAAIDDLPQVHAAVVAVPTHLHGEVVLRLAGRGCPIFCEKPLTSDVASARRIVETAGERVFVMDKWRYHRSTRCATLPRRGVRPRPRYQRSRAMGSPRRRPCVSSPHDLSIAGSPGHLPVPVHAVAEADGEARRHVTGLRGPCGCIARLASVRSIGATPVRCRDGVAVRAI